jgi:uncharacterized protein HemX
MWLRRREGGETRVLLLKARQCVFLRSNLKIKFAIAFHVIVFS